MSRARNGKCLRRFAAVVCHVRQRVDQGVFGYPVVTEHVTRAVVTWAASHYQWRIEPEWLVWLPGLVSGIPAAPTQAGR
jgi:cysteine-S-conjugate beta-lyase